MLPAIPLRTLLVLALFFWGVSAHGADSGTAPGKSMKMDEPMPIEMAKPGMKKGDVKKSAAQKEPALKPMMDAEPAGGAKK